MLGIEKIVFDRADHCENALGTSMQGGALLCSLKELLLTCKILKQREAGLQAENKRSVNVNIDWTQSYFYVNVVQ